MRVIGDKNQISEGVFDFMISYLPFPQKSIHSELDIFFPLVYSIVNAIRVGLAVGALVNSVFINVQANIAAGTRWIDMGMLFTNRK